MTVTTSIFGHTKQGETVTAYRVENRTGMQLTVLDYGATIQSLRVPDRRGELTDVVWAMIRWRSTRKTAGIWEPPSAG